MRNTFVDSVLKHFDRRSDLFMLSGDAGLGVFDEFQKKMPDRFINFGVAEQNMMGFAAGLAMSGFSVFAYNIIPFVLYRCYEQVRNDVCYQNARVTLVGIGSGITYAPQGMTHYSVEDLGVAQSLPGLKIISPMDPIEARLAGDYAVEHGGPLYIRLAKRGEKNIHENGDFDISRPQVIRKGSGVAIVFHGSIAPEAVAAYDELKKEGVTPVVVSVPMLRPLDETALLDILGGARLVVTVEEHYENCGFASIMRELYIRKAPAWKLSTMGLPFDFVHEINFTESMRKVLGVSSGDIVNRVKSLL